MTSSGRKAEGLGLGQMPSWGSHLGASLRHKDRSTVWGWDHARADPLPSSSGCCWHGCMWASLVWELTFRNIL